jgi:hypothetical protein
MDKTCGNCPHLQITGNKRMPMASCKQDDLIVPHQWDGNDFTFWRIPTCCQRTEGVIKSEKQAPKNEWVVKKLSELDLVVTV